MESATMGKVLVTAKIENLNDVFEAEAGTRKPEDIRRVEVTDAMIDTGATMLFLPRRFIQQLGLKQFRTRTARTAAGSPHAGEPVVAGSETAAAAADLSRSTAGGAGPARCVTMQ